VLETDWNSFMASIKRRGWVKTVSVTPPSLTDNTADVDRLTSALKAQLDLDSLCIEIKLSLLKKIPSLLRKWNYNVRCILFKDNNKWDLISITGPQDNISICGLAIDIGTTRVSLRVIDLLTNRNLAEKSFDNPQLSVGPDILTRIHYADQDVGLEKLNKLIVKGINKMIKSVCESIKIYPGQIYILAIAGNTTMTHLLLGLDPHWIIREPYIPVINRTVFVEAKEIGIMVNSSAKALVFPNVGSYFGGDLIAGILFSGLHKLDDTAILVDVGTNAEVVLGNNKWLIACAGAAGPALEGGVTKKGMMANPGVIDKVLIEPNTDKIILHTIDNLPPIGICGSGLIDLAANLFLSGMIDIRGKLKPSSCKGRLKKRDGINHFVLVPSNGSIPELTISQVDLDSLIRSKAAMYTILETITSFVGMPLRELPLFFVAGSFGSFINPKSAISIGMLPDLPIETYRSLGNTSLGGATIALTSEESIDEINKIRDSITYLELNVNQEFMNKFSAAKFLPHTDFSQFPSVRQP